MKKLVLGALLIASTLGTGCIISSDGDDDAVVVAKWTFTHLADGARGDCLNSTDIALVVSQPWNPVTQQNSGAAFVDPFDCDDGQGAVELPDDTYLVWVEIQAVGGAITAKSAQEFVDTADGDQEISYGFYDDGGYFFFSWDLIDQDTGGSVLCSEAGLDHSNASVEVIATSVANPQYFRDDKFDCEDHFGTTDPLLVGEYTVSINAEEDNLLVGEPENIPSQRIVANQRTDLGNIEIQVPTL